MIRSPLRPHRSAPICLFCVALVNTSQHILAIFSSDFREPHLFSIFTKALFNAWLLSFLSIGSRSVFLGHWSKWSSITPISVFCTYCFIACKACTKSALFSWLLSYFHGWGSHGCPKPSKNSLGGFQYLCRNRWQTLQQRWWHNTCFNFFHLTL